MRELLAIALALEVSPVDLLVPPSDEHDHLGLADDVYDTGIGTLQVARDWISGRAPLGSSRPKVVLSAETPFRT